jgi:tRNA threonylcarbamoyladenosine biosynthesis protein TsaB
MKHEKIIAIETSSRVSSVALAEGPQILTEWTFETQAEHGRELIPTLEALCREQGWQPSDISQCHISIGPGSFTGLRMAVAFARTAALANGMRICAVPTLATIAENCTELNPVPDRVAVLLHARRGEVFAGIFDFQDGGYRTVVEATSASPEEILSATRPTAIIGEGITFHREAVSASGAAVVDETLWQPRAAMVHCIGWRMAQRGEFTPARSLVPLYIRRPEAEEVWEKRHGSSK